MTGHLFPAQLRERVRFQQFETDVDRVSAIACSFADPGIMANPQYPEYPISKSGTVTRIRFRDRYYTLSTLHQFEKGGFDLEQLVLPGVEPGAMCGSEGYTRLSLQAEDLHDFDCVAHDFTSPVQAGRLRSTGWYDLGTAPWTEPTEYADIAFAIGYPEHSNRIDFETLTYASRPHAIWGNPGHQRLRGRLSMALVNPLGYAPNGVSGGPLFSLIDCEHHYHAKLAGMVVNASESVLNFLPIFFTATRFSSLFSERLFADM